MSLTQRDSEIVMELAKTLIGMMDEQHPEWSRAYFRFHADEQHYGSTGSYEQHGNVILFGAIRMRPFFDRMNCIAHELWQGRLGFKVMLLTVYSNYDYGVQFEAEDAERWKISKLDGATGIPIGIAAQ